MSRKNDEVLKIYLDHKVHTESNTIDLDDAIDDVSVGSVIRSIHHLVHSGAREVTINISSFGGSVYDGLALYDYLIDLGQDTVINTVAMGKCMSMAPIIYLAGTNRYAYRNTTFMFHEISSYVEGQLETLKTEVKEATRLSKLMASILAEHSNKPARFWSRIKKDKFVTAHGAQQLGVVTHVIGDAE